MKVREVSREKTAFMTFDGLYALRALQRSIHLSEVDAKVSQRLSLALFVVKNIKM